MRQQEQEMAGHAASIDRVGEMSTGFQLTSSLFSSEAPAHWRCLYSQPLHFPSLAGSWSTRGREPSASLLPRDRPAHAPRPRDSRYGRERKGAGGVARSSHAPLRPAACAAWLCSSPLTPLGFLTAWIRLLSLQAGAARSAPSSL